MAEATAVNGEYRVPRWFVGFVSFILSLAVPWAVWSTNKLIVLSVHSTRAFERDVRIDKLTDSMASHVADPGIHHSAFGMLSVKFDSLDDRLKRIEGDIRDLKMKTQ